MTEDKIALRALLEKSPDATFLREMIGFAANRLMELETEGLCGAAHGERTWVTDYRTVGEGDSRHPSLRLCACI